jgi:hypothetical protein
MSKGRVERLAVDKILAESKAKGTDKPNANKSETHLHSDSLSPINGLSKPLPDLVKDANERLGKFAKVIDLMQEADQARYVECRVFIKRLAERIGSWGQHADDPF